MLVDPLRPGHEVTHHPGEATLRMADVVLVAKVNSAADADVQRVSAAVAATNPDAVLLRGASPVVLADAAAARGRRVLVVEDGPSITHGGMAYGAGYVAATQAQVGAVVDPRPWATAPLQAVYAQYPHIGPVLPAVGYGAAQLDALRASLAAADVDLIISATPCDLAALIPIDKPVLRARYEFAEVGTPGLGARIDAFVEAHGLGGS